MVWPWTMTVTTPLFGGGPGGSSAVPNSVHTMVTVAGSWAAAAGIMPSVAAVSAAQQGLSSSCLPYPLRQQAIQQLKETTTSGSAGGESLF
jgi:hypothetical protein